MSEAENVRQLVKKASGKLPMMMRSAAGPVIEEVGEAVAGVVERLEQRIERLEGVSSAETVK